jgi:hypothetical protein
MDFLVRMDTSAVYQLPDRERAEWCPTLAGCKVIIHQHLDATLTLMIAGYRVGQYNAEGKLLTPLTKKQIKAVEKTLTAPTWTELRLPT